MSLINAEPIVGIGPRTSPSAARFSKWLGLTCALLAYWLEWPTWVMVMSFGSAAYGSGAHDGFRWAREQRWMEWMAENVDPDWAKRIDSKWFDCKKQTEL